MDAEEQLRSLGDQIINLAEHDPLKTEIALISLKSIHTLLVKKVEDDEDLSVQYPPYQQNPNHLIEHNPIPTISLSNSNPYGYFEEHPQVYSSTLQNDVMNQARSVPFLFHNQQ